MEAGKGEFPATLMLGEARRSKPASASKATSVSMSGLVRLSADRLMGDVGYPENPDLSALSAPLKLRENA